MVDGRAKRAWRAYKAIQEVMGHSKIQTTFDVYGHLLPGGYDDIRARMDACLAAAA
jgi:integrase